MEYIKRRFPIINWLPTYKGLWIFQDMLAGLTVGLTAIPQAIAYGVVAGLSPEVGLYSAFVGPFLYVIFGSTKCTSIGPTAIMALMVQSMVLNYGPDMAVLICFLKGCIITLLGLFHLGFLLDFVSLPVITGFTSAAALQIASAQFKPLLGITGPSEDFVHSIISVFSNLDQIRLWDTLLGFGTLFSLVLLKNLPGKRTGTLTQKIFWIITLARNAVVVMIGTGIAYGFYLNGKEPVRLTGTMGGGLPSFSWPPFSTTFENKTYSFLEMTSAMGPTLISMPIVSAIEYIAIAKAFAMGKSLDATQEMFVLGLCNIFGSFAGSIPVTASFTRTAVNHASGVRTPLGGIFTGALVLLAVGLLTSTFQFIPKATLAGLIICVMYYMLDFNTCILLWKAKKIDLTVLMVTLLSCLFLGLELGIVIGISFNLAYLMYFSARPSIKIRIEQIDGQKIINVIPEETITFPAADHLRSNIMQMAEENPCNVVFNGRHMKRIDATVAKNIQLLVKDITVRGQKITFVDCRKNVEIVLCTVAPELSDNFKTSNSMPVP